MSKQEFDIYFFSSFIYLFGALITFAHKNEYKSKKELLRNIATILFWFVMLPIDGIINLFNHWKNLPDE